MSDKSLTLDAAAEIDRYTKASIAKINENANALFSRIIAANSNALSAAKDLEKLGSDNARRFENASTASAKMKADVRKLEERITDLTDTANHLKVEFNISRTYIDGVNEMIGKVVTLKSASDVKMTAARMADDGGVLCVWMHDGVVQSASIPLAALDDYRKVQMEML